MNAINYLEARDAPLKDLQHIPGERGWPVVGKLPAMVKDLNGLLHRYHRDYGDVVRHDIGLSMSGVVLLGPDHYKRILLDTEKNFSCQAGYAKTIGVFYGGGLLMRDFDDHRFNRRAFQVAFKTDAMRGYAELMNPIIERSLPQWGNESNFLFFPHVKQLLLAIASKVFFGVDDLGQDAEKLNQAFIDVVERGIMAVIRLKIPGLNYHRAWQSKAFMDEFITGLIDERRSGNGTDFMSHAVRLKTDEGNYFSDRDLVQHLTFLLFAAHDTTTSALSHMVMLLAKNPDIQEQLREESRALGEDQLAYEDMGKLEGLDRAFHESIRLHPSVPLMQRRTIEECEFSGNRIPANTLLFVPPQFSHTMEEWWDQPMKFDPDRFSNERKEHKRHSHSYVPFGGGAHKCLGMHFAIMNVKCFMHQFLLRYRFSVEEGYRPKMQTLPLPKPGDDLPIKLTRI
ncbi:MAG: cytochrome P450 [Halioglobus sp.]